MKDNWTIEQADNGMIVRAEDFVQVIENSCTDNSKSCDNLIHQLGAILYDDIRQVMDEEITNKVKLQLTIEKDD